MAEKGLEVKPTRCIIDQNLIHMAQLAVYGTHATNGVAELHSKLLVDVLFADWYEVYPERFQNKTNGITQRRWLGLCNPELTQLLKYRIGGDFLKDMDRLAKLKPMIDDDMVRQFNSIKRTKKEQLAKIVAEKESV